MRRALALLVASALTLAACDGSLFISTGTIDGNVAQVRLTLIGDASGESWQVTIVTFQTISGTSQMTFCGNQVDRFQMDEDVNVTFTPGTPCASNIVVRVRT